MLLRKNQRFDTRKTGTTMRTLLLTSAGMNVKEEILRILPKLASQTNVAHIITASKAEKDTSYMRKDKQKMLKAGFTVEDIDLAKKGKEELKELLSDKDIIYVQGGNTFYLLEHVKKSGFDSLVRELIDDGKIYIGVSAGSYIACPTIEMATWKHGDRNIVDLKDLSALNLVPFLLSVHYHPKEKEILKKAMTTSAYAVKIITDDQAILIQDDAIALVGKGEEVKI